MLSVHQRTSQSPGRTDNKDHCSLGLHVNQIKVPLTNILNIRRDKAFVLF